MRKGMAAMARNDESRARFSQQSLEQPMNLRSKWCLYGLLSWAAMAGIASAQQPPGSVRLGAPSAEQLPPPITSMNEGVGSVNLGSGMGYTAVDRQFRPRFNVDTRGGGLYGYSPGYTNIGMFVPFDIQDDSSILFLDARGLATHDGGGGANVGLGWRSWIQDIDRIVGLSVWYDFDAGHTANYNQIGLSFESLGRYVDYRVNGYIPVGTRSNILSSTVNQNDILFQGNDLVFRRTNVGEQTFTGFDAEVGGPLPVLGRYGVNGYVGGYHFIGNGDQAGTFTGVSGRFMAQINEDVSFGVQVTDDNLFGTNTQFQVFVTLPEGMPSRWLRNPRVQDRLTQSVFRQGRVMAHTDTYSTFDQAINPKDGLPYFVTHINPNGAAVGTGTFESPFNSILAYNSQLPSPASQQQSDIIYVSPRSDATNTNLDTNPGFTLYDGQRLLSTSVQHTFMSTNFPLATHVLPGFNAGLLPMLINSSGGDVITLAPGNISCLEVSGFDIEGSAGGSGISGTNNSFVLINRNEIHDGFNGINLVNLTNGTSPSIIQNNILRDNVNDGFHLLNIGGPSVTTLELRDNTAYGNGDDGFDIAADAGSTVGGLIDGNSTSPLNGGSPNGDDGLSLSSFGGILAFNTAPDQQISNNIFSDNTGDGVFVDVSAGGVADLLFLANTISNNGNAGIDVPASDNLSFINLVIGGPDDVLDRNTITGNGGPGILFNLSGNADKVTAMIENNLITGNLDGIQVSVANTSVFGPAVGLNTTEIFDNEITGNSRDGIRLIRSDMATLNLGTPAAPPIHNNNISGNTENGLSVIATGINTVLGVPDVVLATQDNIFDSNVLDGLNINAGVTGGVVDDVLVNFDSNRDQFTTNGRHGLNLISNDLANVITNLVNVTANDNTQNGLNTISNDGGLPGTGSGQIINVFSPIDPLYAGTSTFSNNGADGIANTSNQNSTTIINLNPNNENQINVDGNGDDGWNLNRLDASLILASAQKTTFSNNVDNGIEFDYTGTPPTDPNQPQPVAPPPFVPVVFLPNELILNNIIADGNGANGMSTVGAADATLLVNATLSSFTNNALNGIEITTHLGSSFGNIPAPGSPQSIFDALTITGNGANGIHIDENSFLATGSKVFLEVNTDSGDSDISNNSLNGVYAESNGDQTNILLHSTLGNQLTINSNGANGVRWDVTSTGDLIGHQFTVDAATIDGNGGDGVQFDVANVGQGLLTLTNNNITNSGDDGINVNLTALGNPTGASFGFATIVATDNIVDASNGHGVNIQIQGDGAEGGTFPIIDATFTGTVANSQQITNSGLNGVNIEIRGDSGSRANPNAFLFQNNRIARSGQRNVVNTSHGILYQSNAGLITQFGGFQDRQFQFNDGNTLPTPIQPIPALALVNGFNTPYLDLDTDVNSTLQILNNTIETNGTNPGAPGEGVFLRVSTNAYLSSDVSGNTFTGNGSTDFRTESFVATDANGNPINTLASTQVAPPGADTLFLDHTAQLDLQFSNNTGENIDPVTAIAVFPGEAAKGAGGRIVSLFQVDNVPGGVAGELNTTNAFTALPVGSTVFTLFLGDFDNLTSLTPWSLNNATFPQDFNASPGNPFLP